MRERGAGGDTWGLSHKSGHLKVGSRLLIVGSHKSRVPESRVGSLMSIKAIYKAKDYVKHG